MATIVHSAGVYHVRQEDSGKYSVFYKPEDAQWELWFACNLGSLDGAIQRAVMMDFAFAMSPAKMADSLRKIYYTTFRLAGI